jgi:hypothetical protein
MNIDMEAHIRERAYTLWQQEGGPEGRALEYWSRAERETAAMHEAMQRATESPAAKAPKKGTSASAASRQQAKTKRAKTQDLHA